MKKLLFLFFILGCAHSPKAIKISCPPKPVMRPVTVVDGVISGDSLQNTIDNHVDLWEYIHKVTSLGCNK